MNTLTEAEVSAKIQNFLIDRSKVHPDLRLLEKQPLKKQTLMARAFARRREFVTNRLNHSKHHTTLSSLLVLR